MTAEKIKALSGLGDSLGELIHHLMQLEHALGIAEQKPPRGRWPSNMGLGALVETAGRDLNRALQAYQETDGIHRDVPIRFNVVEGVSYTYALIQAGWRITTAWGKLSDPEGENLQDFRELVRETISERNGLESWPHAPGTRPIQSVGVAVGIEVAKERKRLEQILAPATPNPVDDPKKTVEQGSERPKMSPAFEGLADSPKIPSAPIALTEPDESPWTGYQTPHAWRMWLKKNGRPHSESTWKRFKKDRGGESRRNGKNHQSVRFLKSKLQEDGLTWP